MFLDAAGTVMARCATLACYSEEPDRLTRRFASPPMREVNALVAGWMQAAGMAVRQDALVQHAEAVARPLHGSNVHGYSLTPPRIDD